MDVTLSSVTKVNFGNFSTPFQEKSSSWSKLKKAFELFYSQSGKNVKGNHTISLFLLFNRGCLKIKFQT